MLDIHLYRHFTKMNYTKLFYVTYYTVLYKSNQGWQLVFFQQLALSIDKKFL